MSDRPPNGGLYRSESCRPLTAGQIRERQFRNVRIKRALRTWQSRFAPGAYR